MSIESVKSNFHFLELQHKDGKLLWNKPVADVFSKLLGSGYVPSSIRSLWPHYDEQRRAGIGYLLEVTERWRDSLRKNHSLEDRINEGFLRATRTFFEFIEKGIDLPPSELFVIENNGLRWNAKLAELNL